MSSDFLTTRRYTRNLLSMTSLKTIKIKSAVSISLAATLLAFSAGYFLGQSQLNFSQGNKSQAKPVASSGGNVKINSLSGTVQSINGKAIILKVNESDARTAEIDSQTKIYLQEQKSPDQYQKETDEYFKKTQQQMA